MEKSSMKLVRYITFLSILVIIFFLIYRQSYQKGFIRWLRSFKLEVLLAAIGSGLIPSFAKTPAIPSKNYTQIERLYFRAISKTGKSIEIEELSSFSIEELEFIQVNPEQITLLKDTNNSGKLGKSGPGARAKADGAASARAKRGSTGKGGSGFAQAFPPPNP
jgi:hypothetical protein